MNKVDHNLTVNVTTGTVSDSVTMTQGSTGHVIDIKLLKNVVGGINPAFFSITGNTVQSYLRINTVTSDAYGRKVRVKNMIPLFTEIVNAYRGQLRIDLDEIYGGAHGVAVPSGRYVITLYINPMLHNGAIVNSDYSIDLILNITQGISDDVVISEGDLDIEIIYDGGVIS